jgi:hypothetical protein
MITLLLLQLRLIPMLDDTRVARIQQSVDNQFSTHSTWLAVVVNPSIIHVNRHSTPTRSLQYAHCTSFQPSLPTSPTCRKLLLQSNILTRSATTHIALFLITCRNHSDSRLSIPYLFTISDLYHFWSCRSLFFCSSSQYCLVQVRVCTSLHHDLLTRVWTHVISFQRMKGSTLCLPRHLYAATLMAAYHLVSSTTINPVLHTSSVEATYWLGPV